MTRSALPRQASPHLGVGRLLDAQPHPRQRTSAPERVVPPKTTGDAPSARAWSRPLEDRSWQRERPSVEVDGSDDTVGKRLQRDGWAMGPNTPFGSLLPVTTGHQIRPRQR